MMFNNILLAALSLSLLVSSTAAAISTKCSSSNVCFSLNIPDTTALSGTGDIYLQISAPTTYSWIGLAQGNKMANANYFVIYTSSSGKNVTLSPRSDTGVRMPIYNNATQVELLEGSGVMNGVMVANIKCSNCNSWTGGSMDFKTSSTNWIWAGKAGSPLNTDDKSAAMSKHDSSTYGTFHFDSSAKGGSKNNPFISSQSGDISNGCTSTTKLRSRSRAFGFGFANRKITAITLFKRDSHTAESIVQRSVQNSCSTISSVSENSSSTTGDGDRNHLVMIHGYLACFIFAVVFPSGGIMMRLLSFKGLLWAHAGLQLFGYLTYFGSAGLGIWLIAHDYTINLEGPHAIIGLILLGALLLQAPFGYMHHRYYKQIGCRTLWSHLHLWIGRLAIPVGIANGVFGFHKARESILIQVVFAMFGGFIFLVYIGSAIYGERKRRQKIEAETTVAIAEIEDALKIGMPFGGAGGGWSKANSWNTSGASTQLSKMVDSKVTLVNPKSSFGSLSHQQQVAWNEIPKLPQIHTQTWTHKTPRQASIQSINTVPSIKSCSSIYSPQLPQQPWTFKKPPTPIRSSSLHSPKPSQQTWTHKTTARMSMQSMKTLPSIKSVSSLTSTRADAPGSYVPRLTGGGGTTIVRSKSAALPSDVPMPNDDDYYLYRFGYGRE